MKWRWPGMIPLCTLLLLVNLAGPVQAQNAPDLSQQIDHLIDFIRTSPCTFIRNDTDYDGKAAADHVRQKYEHFVDDIHSAEDFIELAATKSMLSGRPYEVRCPGKPTVTANAWLRTELQAYRSGTGTP